MVRLGVIVGSVTVLNPVINSDKTFISPPDLGKGLHLRRQHSHSGVPLSAVLPESFQVFFCFLFLSFKNTCPLIFI